LRFLSRSIAIGTGPTVPFDVLRDLNLGSPHTPITPIPPVAWFERLVNLAVNNFIRSLAGGEPGENGGDWY